MRLLPIGKDTFEVQCEDREIGRVWLYAGQWRAETKSGTPVHVTRGMSAREAGWQVEAVYKTRG